MIVTVTPNPALDLTYLLPESGAHVDVQRATSSVLEASGKGVNVSRALVNAGVATCAVLPAGGATGRALTELLDDDGVPHRVVAQHGATRVNTTALHAGGATAKLNGPGSALTDEEQDALLGELERALDGADVCRDGSTWVALCGSLPPGVETRFVVDVVDLAHRHGAKCAVDASGDALAAALHVGADLLAPNRAELAAVDSSIPLDGSIAVLADAVRSLSVDAEAALLISLGADGALFTDGRRVLHGYGPALTPVNTAGAGDALLAGWLASSGEPNVRLAQAIRWGRSACLAITTVDPDPGAGDTSQVTIREP